MFRGAMTIEQMSSNRSITDAWRAHQHREHQERIKNVKHALDNKPPKQYPHLSTRYKRETQMEERYRQIEQDNRLLLQVGSLLCVLCCAVLCCAARLCSVC
jgi:hypothetical protein